MNRKMQCLIIDDEKIAREVIASYVAKLQYLELVGQCKNAFEALDFLQSNTIDLIFLDIQMPELTGMELLCTLPERPMVVFTTAYAEFALEGYQMDIVDYLLKPIRFERFVQAAHKVLRRMQAQKKLTLPLSNAPVERNYIIVRAEHKIHLIKFEEIVYIQGMKEYVVFYLTQGRIIALQSLKQLEEDLPENRFLRIHKSFIVSLDKISTLEGSSLNLIGEEKLPIGGSYKDRLVSLILD